MTRKIIGLTGKKQSGKTTAAGHLIRSGYVRVSFADGMKDMIRALLKSCGYSDGHVDLIMLSQKETTLDDFGKSPREMMQLLGTDWGRHLIHEDIWVMAARQKVNQLPDFNIVFDDVRFENEAAMIRRLNGLVIHVYRDNDLPVDHHISEAGVIYHPADKNVINNGSINSLYDGVYSAIRAHFGGVAA